MKKIYTIKLLLVIILVINNLTAQDIHFSQFNENASLVNPALLSYKSAFRATGTYRSQWKSVTTPYNTYGISIESKLRPSNWEQADNHRQMIYKKSVKKGSVGLSIYNDKGGDGKLSTTLFNLSFASFVKTGSDSKIAYGIQAGFAQKKIDYSKLIFTDQYNGTSYDASVASNEKYAGQSIVYPDFAAGLSWIYAKQANSFTANNQRYANFGAAIYHLTRPRQSFINNSSDRLDIKYNVHGNLSLGLGENKVGLEPGFLVQKQGKNLEIVAGTYVKYLLDIDSKYTGFNKHSSIGIGMFYRNNDAFITTFLLEYKEYALGLSYDVNVSKLKTVTTLRGGFEVNFRFSSSAIYLYQTK